MKTIALLGLYYDDNLGDPLMVECVKYIYKKLGKEKKIELDFQYIDLFGRKSSNELCKRKRKIPVKVIKKLATAIFPQLYGLLHDVRFQKDDNGKKRLNMYFNNKLIGCDMLVIVGGALVKYRYIRDFHNPMNTLNEVAENLGIPIFFNAAGVENGYNIKFHGCKIVRQYLNSKNIKKITTRDDIETLYKYIDNSSTIVNKSADTAVWCDKIFQIKPNIKSQIIGVGVIEPARFVQYAQGITEAFYERWLCGLLQLMDERHMKWRLFTNGHKGDYIFALKVLKKMNLNEDMLVVRPRDYKELIRTINGFKLVVASRLHACIIAYSLNKPIVGIDWNDKLLFFGKDIQLSENFFKPANKTPIEVVEIIKNSMNFQYDTQIRATYRESVLKSLEQSLEFIKQSGGRR